MGVNKGSALILILGSLMVASIIVTAYILLFPPVKTTTNRQKQPLTWEECLKTSGARELQTYPETCVTPDGRQVTQPLSDSEKQKTVPPKVSASICDSKTFGYPIGIVYECADFNLVFPAANVMDAPMIVTDKNLKEIDSCGGMAGPNGPNSCPEKYLSTTGCKETSCPRQQSGL